MVVWLKHVVASVFKRDQIRSLFGHVWGSLPPPPQTVWPVPEAASTILRTPDDGREGRPKHVE